jgi:group I intron endonuclease
MPYYVYKIINKLNNKIYVGKTTKIKKRWNQHKNNAFSDNPKTRAQCPKLYNAIRKYGTDNFAFSIIKECISDDEMSKEEIRLIAELDTIKCGYNITAGGDGPSGIHHPWWGRKHTEQSIKKMVQTHTGRKLGPATAERKQKISQALIGKEKPYQKGENNCAAKLKDVDIPIIRKLHKENKSYVDIAKIFNVSDVAIRCIIVEKTWKHVR